MIDLYIFDLGNNKKRLIGLQFMIYEETMFLKSDVYFGLFANLKGQGCWDALYTFEIQTLTFQEMSDLLVDYV